MSIGDDIDNDLLNQFKVPKLFKDVDKLQTLLVLVTSIIALLLISNIGTVFIVFLHIMVKFIVSNSSKFLSKYINVSL